MVHQDKNCVHSGTVKDFPWQMPQSTEENTYDQQLFKQEDFYVPLHL